MQESLLSKIPQVVVKLELDDPPTREEIRKATMQLKVGKSQDTDGIPAEVYQQGGEAVLDKLKICSPTARRKGLYRTTSGMQSLSLCTKTRGGGNQTVQTTEASLLSIIGKILARILTNKKSVSRSSRQSDHLKIS